MPLYAYRCSACGAQEEHIQRFSDPPETVCQVCGGPLEKLLSGASFHLKGGGWYKDGYASTKPGDSGSSSASSEGSSSSPASSGGDASSTPSGGKSDAGSTTGKKAASE